jgi:hemolysin D
MEKQIEAQKAQSLSDILNELDELTRQCEAVRQELAKVRDLGSKQVLYAPVKGTIKGLVANTVGGVVSPAQVLMELVPMDEILEVEAFISNQDIGYVRATQTAEVKIHTFPFTKYGVIDATVAQVADDATVDEKLGLIYRTRLVLAKNKILVDGRDVPLMPGMAVSAEIATDKRRLIEFFLAPLLRMKDESLRER